MADVTDLKSVEETHVGSTPTGPILISGPTGPYKSGYLQVRVRYSDGRYKIITYHQYIYESIYGEIPFNHVVHHINENKLDNRIENLQLMSRSEHGRLHAKTGIEYIELICPLCKKQFKLEMRHYRTKRRLNHIAHCSRRCAGKNTPHYKRGSDKELLSREALCQSGLRY